MFKIHHICLFSLILSIGCSKDTKTEVTTTSVEPIGAVQTPEETPKAMPFVPDVPTNPLPADHPIAQLAGRILTLDSGPWSEAVMTRLSPPTPSTRPPHDGLRTQYWQFKTAEGTFELGLTYKDGTWEQPRGNSAPNRHQPEVIEIQLTGPGHIDLSVPEDAQTMRFNATDGTERQMSAWQDFAYFEQGHQGRPWMVARTVGRGTFHATTEERADLEDVLLDLSDAMKKQRDLDLQIYLASRAKDFKKGEQLYDFGVGTIHAARPDVISVSWTGPTKVSRFFEHLGDVQIMTSFAHNYGEMAKTIELDHMRITPADYYILRPRMHYEESGLAANAHFRRLQILRPSTISR